ncbi:hypothetical protein [Compostimonas suwonensis]|uniref:copper amine oxidase n=1 Tax=Compostimonas suwonensis TaxID=1048394 RepID=UPI001473EF1D|nr:hypothetical protein [Compostimonas suwonensis]
MKLALIGVLIATGGTLAIAQPASAAQSVTEASCTGKSLVQETLKNSSGWEMCWRVDTYRGLILDKVAFTPPKGDRPMMVLDSIGLSQLNVPYDDGQTEYNDVTSYQVGGRRLQALTEVDCPTGEVRTAFATEELPDLPTLCISEDDSGLAYRSNVSNSGLYVKQGTDLVLHIMTRISWYEYQTEYRFHDDGEISVRIGATGDLAPSGFSDAATGWPIGEGETDYATSHYHSAFWRVDFGLDNASNTQLVEKFDTEPTGEYGTDTDTGHTAVLETAVTPVEKEGKVIVDKREGYRVVNPNSINPDGHERSYEIIMERDQAYALNPETDYDIAFTQPKSNEIHASYNLAPDNAGKGVTDYIADNEDLNDPVAYVNVGFHHIVRDEDQSPMPIHWQGFTLYPRDVTKQAPDVPAGRACLNGENSRLNSRPCPTDTPTPTPTPTETTSPTPTPTATETTMPTPTDSSSPTPSTDPTTGPSADPSTGPTPSSSPTTPPVARAAAGSVTTSPIAPGSVQGVSASGFTPGETVSATMYSEPVAVGTTTASGAGDVGLSFAVPGGTSAGSHKVVLVGQDSGTTVEIPFEVVQPAAAFGFLSSTGFGAGPFAFGGIALLVLGAGLAVLAWTQRRRSHTALSV